MLNARLQSVRANHSNKNKNKFILAKKTTKTTMAIRVRIYTAHPQTVVNTMKFERVE